MNTIFDQLDDEEKKKTIFDSLDQTQQTNKPNLFDSLDKPVEPQKPDFMDFAVQQVLGAGLPFAEYQPLNLLLKGQQEAGHPKDLNVPNPERQPGQFSFKGAAPVNMVAKGIDLLMRGQYASATAAHSILQSYEQDTPDTIINALQMAGKEAINPEARLSYSDVINRHFPDFAKEHPLTAEAAGFLLDIVADPVTYFGGVKEMVSIPTQTTERLGALALNKKGVQAFGKILTTGVTRDVAEATFRKQFGEMGVEEAGKLLASDKASKFLPSRWAGMDLPILSKKPNVLRLQQDAFETNRIMSAIETLKENQKLVADMPSRASIEATAAKYEALRNKAMETARKEVAPLKQRSEDLAKNINIYEQNVNMKDPEQLQYLDKMYGQQIRVDREIAQHPAVAQEAAHKQKLDEIYGQLSQWDQMDKQAEDMRRIIAGPERPPRPIVIPDDHPLDAPFRAIEKLPGMRDVVEDFRPGQALKRMKSTIDYMFGTAFQPKYAIKDAVGGVLDKLQVKVMNSDAASKDFAMQFFRNHSMQEQRQVTEAMFAVESEVRSWEKAHPGMEIADHELADLRQKVLSAIPEGKGDKALTAQARASVFRYTAEDARRGELYKDLGLIDQLQKGHAYHLAKNVDPEVAYRYSRWKKAGLPESFAPGEQKFYRTVEEMRAAGLKPEMSAAVLLGSYVSDAEKALIMREGMQDIAMHYGVKDFNEIEKAVSPREWERLNSEIAYLSSPNYSLFQHKPWLKKAARALDFMTTPFRAGATFANPAFASKQVFGNAMQMLMENGAKSWRVIDPSAHYAAMAAVFEHMGILDKLPETPFSDLFKVLGSQRQEWRSAIGEKISVQQLANEMKNIGAISDVHIGSGNRMSKRFKTEMLKQEIQDSALRALKLNNKPVFEGIAAFVGQMANYQNWPEFVENYGKAFTYVNGRLAGYGPKQAGEKMFRALYNYGRGMTEIERQVVKRLIPFYSYPRFTAELAATALFNTPGRIAGVKKGIDHFLSAYGKIAAMMRGEDNNLTEDERKSVPGFLLEMPTAYLGKDIVDGKVAHVFNSFTNFSPIDSFMLLENDQLSNETNLRRSFEKNVLGALNPWLKVLFLELPQNKSLFSGGPIKRPDDEVTRGKPNMQRIGTNLDADKMLGHMLAALGGGTGGTIGAIGGKIFGDTVAGMGGTDIMKKMLGWEEFPNPDGSRTVYVNPYLYHVMASFYPTLRRVIRWDDEAKSPAERNFELLSGVLISKRNLKEDYWRKGVQLKKEYTKRSRELVKDEMLNKQRLNSEKDWSQLLDARRKYEELLGYIKDYGTIDESNIR